MSLKLQDIYKSSLTFLEPLNPDKTYYTVVEEAKQLLGADYGTILLNVNGKLKRVYACLPVLAKAKVRRNGRTVRAFKTREPFYALVMGESDIHVDLYPLGIKTIIFIPLVYKKKNIGVLNLLCRRVKKLSKQELLLLKLFGSMVSLAIYKADQYKRAEQAIRARDMFIAMASHELRTPLTTITVYARLLLAKLSRGTMPDIQWIKTLYAQTMWLNKLTVELLEINTIKKKKFHFAPERVSLREILGKAEVTFSATFPKHKLEIIDSLNSKNDIVKVDYYKLLQVFINVLNNAGKFSPAGSTVTLLLGKERRSLTVSIRDTGEGIDKKDMPNIFKGFYKGKSNKEGMGLGLFLVKEIVEHSRGKISVSSQLGHGTTVQIRLPQQKI